MTTSRFPVLAAKCWTDAVFPLPDNHNCLNTLLPLPKYKSEPGCGQVILKMKSRNLRKNLGNLGISEKNLGNLVNFLPSEERFYNLLEARRPENKRGPKGLSES